LTPGLNAGASDAPLLAAAAGPSCRSAEAAKRYSRLVVAFNRERRASEAAALIGTEDAARVFLSSAVEVRVQLQGTFLLELCARSAYRSPACQHRACRLLGSTASSSSSLTPPPLALVNRTLVCGKCLSRALPRYPDSADVPSIVSEVSATRGPLEQGGKLDEAAR
jgi:hypothetical protein